MVFPNGIMSGEGKRQATASDTLFSAAFSSLAGAKYWYHIQQKTNRSQDFFCKLAAQYGNLEALHWACLSDFDWDWTTCFWAAENGHLDCLQFAHGKGCEWSADVCEAAATQGHFELLKWAHKNGCPRTEAAPMGATENGHLEILKWA